MRFLASIHHRFACGLVFVSTLGSGLLAGCGDSNDSGTGSAGSGSFESDTTAAASDASDPSTGTVPTTTAPEGSGEGPDATGSVTDGPWTTGSSGPDCEGPLVYPDTDMDGFGDPAHPTLACEAPTTEPHVMDNTDCNDGDPGIHPGAPEDECDGIDHDCSGQWKTTVRGRTGALNSE